MAGPLQWTSRGWTARRAAVDVAAVDLAESGDALPPTRNRTMDPDSASYRLLRTKFTREK